MLGEPPPFRTRPFSLWNVEWSTAAVTASPTCPGATNQNHLGSLPLRCGFGRQRQSAQTRFDERPSRKWQ